MARKRSRSRYDAGLTARRTPLLNESLVHTAAQPDAIWSDADAEVMNLRIGVSETPVRSLIRTVLPDRGSVQPRPVHRGSPPSPVARSRATGRSSQRQVRSPFLNATMLTPELTQRAMVCARRGIRREVLFATRRTGKGSRSQKRYFSKVRC